MQSLSPEPLLSEEDYGAIEAAVMETARGRWFLAEYARRNRNADTEAVLTAIRRLERLVHSAASFDARDEVTRGMADIAQAIAAAQSSPPTLEAFSRPAAEAVRNDPPAGDAAANDVEAGVPEPVEAIEETPFIAATLSASDPAPVDSGPGAQAAAATVDQGWEGLELAATELAALGLPPELASSDAVSVEAAEEQADPAPARTEQDEAPASSGASPSQAADLFPILELDEEATEALLTLDVPRQELILPPNHLAPQRWHKELAAGEEEGSPAHRLDKWAAISRASGTARTTAVANDGGDRVLDMVAVVEEALEPTPPSGLVTFIDEEPVEEEQSIFTAPLRLEPEQAADQALPEIERRPAAAATSRPAPARLTIGEIEAMPFTKKAALFS